MPRGEMGILNWIRELAADLAETDHEAALRIAERLERQAAIAKRFPALGRESRTQMKSS
jgi:hypothetical protein